ncbi:hypothetical protein L1D52_15410 [Vibrio brasiliensis]|uniref:hypothetical protein n=1 Tax=Vibrio brasiliensis TaxID=170652 RepID=UPI001EFD94B6|nr:hypothetical protein [Vibrio brasiliensis]MCG9783738.1 hypothetical protein [Vibrio brasiliensis]
MKYATIIATAALIFSSTVIASNEKKGTFKIGDNADDIPCTCVFNKNRMWNPETIMWNNEEWYCSNYNEDGTCASVALVNPTKLEATCDKDAIPLYCIFNVENAPKTVIIEGESWKCGARNQLDNMCIKAVKSQ